MHSKDYYPVDSFILKITIPVDSFIPKDYYPVDSFILKITTL